MLLPILLLLPLGSIEDKRLAIYAPQLTYSVRALDRDNREYVDLISVLEPLATTSIKITGDTCKIQAGDKAANFADGKTQVNVGQTQVKLSARAILENGRVLVPSESLPAILSAMVSMQSELHEAGRRLFLENTATRFTVEVRTSEGGQLVLGFPSRVNPTISTEGNRLHMVFAQEPVIGGVDNLNFNDSLISSIRFEEKNGAAEITVTGNSPLLASFTNSGKTILVRAAPAPVISQAPPSPAVNPASGIEPSKGPTPVPASTAPATNVGTMETAIPQSSSGPQQLVNGAAPYFVMIDPGHGGSDPGVRFSEKLTEKDVTMALARRLKTELQNRGVSAVLLREGDISLSNEQRAVAANGQRAAIYVSLHAGGPGNGVRVYTTMMPNAERAEGPFIPWDRAQENFQQRSLLLAQSVAIEIGNKKMETRVLSVAIPPLNHLAMPAIAIELSHSGDEVSKDDWMKPSYQISVASAMASAISSSRGKLEEMR